MLITEKNDRWLTCIYLQDLITQQQHLLWGTFQFLDLCHRQFITQEKLLHDAHESFEIGSIRTNLKKGENWIHNDALIKEWEPSCSITATLPDQSPYFEWKKILRRMWLSLNMLAQSFIYISELVCHLIGNKKRRKYFDRRPLFGMYQSIQKEETYARNVIQWFLIQLAHA